jgi:hypothetical protein
MHQLTMNNPDDAFDKDSYSSSEDENGPLEDNNDEFLPNKTERLHALVKILAVYMFLS